MFRRAWLFGIVLAAVAGSFSAAGPKAVAEEDHFQASMAPLLFQAVRNDDLAAVKSTLKAGADVTVKDDQGRTPLDLALEKGYFDIAQFLLTARREQQQRSLQIVAKTAPTAPEGNTPPVAEADAPPAPAPGESQTSQPVDQLANAAEKLATVAEHLARMAETSNSKNIRIELVEPGQAHGQGAVASRPAPRVSNPAPAPAARPVPRVTASPAPDIARAAESDTGDNASVIAEAPASPGFRPQPGRKPEIARLAREATEPPPDAAPASETVEVALDRPADQIPAEPDETTPTPGEMAAMEPQIREADLAPPERSKPAAAPKAAPAAPAAPAKTANAETANGDGQVPDQTVGGFFKGLGNLLGISGEKQASAEPAATPPPSAPALPKDAPGDATQLAAKPVLPLAKIDADRTPLPPAATEAPPPPAEPAVQLARRTPPTERRRIATIRKHERPMPVQRLRAPMSNVLLTLGDSVTTGQPRIQQGVGEPNACVTKRSGAAFCIVPVDWPPEIDKAFEVNTILYQGARAVARYDHGHAVHFHALFKSEDSDKVVAYLTKKFGDPTDVWRRVIAPFGKPRQPNPTFVWRSKNAKTKQTTVLEVRKFDDARAVFPDTEHGSVRLYIAGGPAVFPAVTALDIMSIDWAARSDHGAPASAPVANTIPITR